MEVLVVCTHWFKIIHPIYEAFFYVVSPKIQGVDGGRVLATGSAVSY